MTGSPVLVGDTVITGVSASGASGPNATFRADIVALDAVTGTIRWRAYSLPDNGGRPGGYARATMFSPPAVDVAAGLVFGTFGQPYTEPAAVKACNAASPSGLSESCEQPGSYLDSIVAFDLHTGQPVWSYRVLGHTAWENACGSQPPVVTWCAPESDNPLNGGNKWDVDGSGPNVFRIGGRDVVGVGEKSAATGAIRWAFAAGSSVNSAPAIVDGSVYWGTGYSRSGIEGSGNTRLFAFKLRPPGNLDCVNQALTGLVQGNLRVPKGAWCDLTNNVRITGNLDVEQSTGIRIVGATIDGNVEVRQTSGSIDPMSPGLNVICDTTIKGNLQVADGDTGAVWNIGGGTGCGNSVGGNLDFDGNRSSGNTVSANLVTGNLECNHNGSVAGGGNRVRGDIEGSAPEPGSECLQIRAIAGRHAHARYPGAQGFRHGVVRANDQAVCNLENGRSVRPPYLPGPRSVSFESAHLEHQHLPDLVVCVSTHPLHPDLLRYPH